jgi:glutamyl-Q tRNA(Asp) synthetase
MTTNCIIRFAPSPTGLLHLGHAWSALQAYDLARARGGQFLLRIEDIDQGRCRSDFIEAIFEDLHWLGLDWDGPIVYQSHRMAIYDAALGRLQAMGLVYRCWCTRREIAESAGAPQGNAGAIYPGTCRSRGDAGLDLPYCWRLDMAKAVALAGEIAWHDARCGVVIASPAAQGDIVIARKDAATSYHLAVTVDDAAQGVTDIVRGVDLFAATHIHRLLQALLDLPTPHYHHHALLLDGEGERLAKRRNSPSIRSLRDAGTRPKDVVDALRARAFPFGFALADD